MVGVSRCGRLPDVPEISPPFPSTVPSLVTMTTPYVLTGHMTPSKDHLTNCMKCLVRIYFVYIACKCHSLRKVAVRSQNIELCDVAFSLLSFLAVGSRDMVCRVYSLHPIPGFRFVTLAAHRTALVACFFEESSLNVCHTFCVLFNTLAMAVFGYCRFTLVATPESFCHL